MLQFFSYIGLHWKDSCSHPRICDFPCHSFLSAGNVHSCTGIWGQHYGWYQAKLLLLLKNCFQLQQKHVLRWPKSGAEQCLYLKALLTSERITMHILLLKCIWSKLGFPSPPLIHACISPLVIELLVTPWIASRASTYQWNNPLQVRVETSSEPIAPMNYNSSKNSVKELLGFIGLIMPISQNQKVLKLCTCTMQEQVHYKCH